MDLDQLIYDADPARGLEIDIPDPRRQQARHRPGNWGGILAVVLAVVIVAVVGVVALSIGGKRPTATPAIPVRLPFSSPAAPAPGPGVLLSTAHLAQIFPDPAGGPAWGVRMFQTRSGMTCVQAGRTESGAIGAIGIDGAYGSDLRFHPIAVKPYLGLGECARGDARSHAFINVADVNTGASAGLQPCIYHDLALPREHCPAGSLRDVYFGLLGPDATSITYLGAGGRRMVERTRGPDGAYLVVRPVAQGPCSKALMRQLGGVSSCDYDAQGEEGGPNLRSGEITAVSYRGGRVCHLPAPHGVVVAWAQCPVVGYAAPPVPHVTAAQVRAPVSVRLLSVERYCLARRSGHPTIRLPCRGSIPPGYRVGPSNRRYDQRLVEISWTARAPVNSPNSLYNYSVSYPCNRGGLSGNTRTRLHAGQRVTVRLQLQLFDCKGSYAIVVRYVPSVGPGGPVGGGPSLAGSLLVGRDSFTVN